MSLVQSTFEHLKIWMKVINLKIYSYENNFLNNHDIGTFLYHKLKTDHVCFNGLVHVNPENKQFNLYIAFLFLFLE